MVWEGTGNVQPAIDRAEHSNAAIAKRVLPVGLEDGGIDYVSPTVKDFEVQGRSALEVILVDPLGELYDAGEISGTVTVGGGFLEASVSLTGDVNITSGTVTVGGGFIESSASITGDINITTMPETNVIAALTGDVDITTMPETNVIAALTGDVDITGAVGTEIRHRTFYIPTLTADQFPNIGTSYGGMVISVNTSQSSSIFVGSSVNVNTTVGDTESGFEIEPGGSLSIPVDVSTRVWAVAATATCQVSIANVIP